MMLAISFVHDTSPNNLEHHNPNFLKSWRPDHVINCTYIYYIQFY